MAYTIPNNTEYITYEINNGDTYASIANRYGLEMSELVALNNFDAFDLNTIWVGSVINVGVKDKTTGTVLDLGIITDDEIEKAFYEASLQAISVDTATQERLNAIKETYRETGTLDSIANDLLYLTSEKGYTAEEVKLLLNEYNIDISGIDEKLVDKTLERSVNQSTSGTFYDDSDFSKDTILGLPFRYNTYSDPRRRVYNSTFMVDAPIVSIIPGKPLFRGAEENNDGLEGIIDELFGTNGSNSDEEILNITNNRYFSNDDDILNWLKASQKSNEKNGDLRYYRFQEDYNTFEKYLDLNLSTLAVKMGIGSLGNARYSNFMKNQNSQAFLGISRAFKFYCTKSGTSSNESIQNDFGDSQIAGTMNGISETVQELKYLLGTSSDDPGLLSNGTSTLIDSITQIGSSLMNTLTGEKVSFDGSLGQFNAAAKAAVSGNKLIWPLIWKNSTFNRSYSLSFDFVSPYGSPEAIFRYVYLPFITLLTLAMPKQYGTSGYCNPFLIRLEMPGKFTSDLAVIDNMTWRKGGNDNLFTDEGLPLAISVEISVKDLYPNMMMSESWAQLRHNTGMHSFLDNMAGLSVERFTPWQNLKNSLTIKSVNVLGNFYRDTIGDFKTKIYSLTTANEVFGNSLN